MPLRDHFHVPGSKHWLWEGFHGYWPTAMVRELERQLPAKYVAEPRVKLGMFAEQYEYAVLVYNVENDRKLVAAVEIVCPANKEGPANRRHFVAKCANLVQKDVSMSIVDLIRTSSSREEVLITTENAQPVGKLTTSANLFADMLELTGRTDPDLGDELPAMYAVTCRQRQVERKAQLEFWSHELAVGKPLPDLPIWLTDSLAVSLNLEASYEETCRVLRIA